MTVLSGCGEPKCGVREAACGGSCVDLQLDPDHCGSCDRACESGDYCSVGACAATCLAGLSACDGRCVDTTTDRDHCGSCGHACGNGEVCSGSTCGASCGALALCGDACVD